MRRWLVAAMTLLTLAGCLDSGTEGSAPLVDEDGRPIGESLRLVRVVEGLSAPVFVAAPPDGSLGLFVVEQAGTVRLVVDGAVQGEPLLDLRDVVRSGGFEQGLLGLAFHPAWPEDRRVFVDYTAVPDGRSVLASYEADVDSGRFDTASAVVLLEVEQPYSNHNGGMLAFGPDGMLYWGLGDGGAGGDPHGNAQDVGSLLGKILRLDVSDPSAYSVPADNPFVGRAGRDEVWVLGLRNPWRFSFDEATGDLWIGDVGQDRWEEVDVLPAGHQAGANLGWSVYEGSERFRSGEVVDAVMPVAEYALVGDHAAVVGGYRYRGDAIAPLQGVFLFADWGSGWVWGVEPDGEGGWAMGRLMTTNRHISSFGQGADGTVYVVDHGGAVLRLERHGGRS